MSYDLFISYSRRDNDPLGSGKARRVTELKDHIAAGYRSFSGTELNCFFDVEEIRGGDDWRDRILGALRESRLLLLVLSPHYLASQYCEWEIVEYQRNPGAVAFWRKIIAAYCAGRFTEVARYGEVRQRFKTRLSQR